MADAGEPIETTPEVSTDAVADAATASSAKKGKRAFDFDKVHWSGSASKFGFKIGMRKSKGALWKERFFQLRMNGLKYYAKEGGQLKGSMAFSATTYATRLDPAALGKNTLPVTAHEAGFRVVAKGGEAIEFGDAPADISSHFPVILAVYNCIFEDKVAHGPRCFLLAWDSDEEGGAECDKVASMINSWLPCKDGDDQRLPRTLIPHIGADPEAASDAIPGVVVPPKALVHEPCTISIRSGISEGRFAHRCRVDIRLAKPSAPNRPKRPASQSVVDLMARKEAVKRRARLEMEHAAAEAELQGAPDGSDAAQASDAAAAASAAAEDEDYIHDGKHYAHTELVDNLDGTYTTTFTPSCPGEFHVYVRFWGREATGLPATVEASGLHVLAEGPGVTGGLLEAEKAFTIDARHPDGSPETGLEEGRLTVFVRHNGQEIPAEDGPKLSVLEDGGYHVTYKGEVPGTYVVGIKLDGRWIPDAPFIFDLKTEAAAAEVTGEGLKGGKTFHPAEFEISLLNEERTSYGYGGDYENGLLAVTVEQPGVEVSELPVKVRDQEDGTYKCSFTPSRFGTHRVTVSYNSKVLKGCPFSSYIEPDERWLRDEILAFYASFSERAVKGLTLTKFPASKIGTVNERVLQVLGIGTSQARLSWHGKKDASAAIPITEVQSVASGHREDATHAGFLKADDTCVFSLQTPTRWLDLAAPTHDERDGWVRFLEMLIEMQRGVAGTPDGGDGDDAASAAADSGAAGAGDAAPAAPAAAAAAADGGDE